MVAELPVCVLVAVWGLVSPARRNIPVPQSVAAAVAGWE